jgi:putative transposase
MSGTKKNTSSSEHMGIGLYFYFSALSLRRAAESCLFCQTKPYASIWNWIKNTVEKNYIKEKKAYEYVIDETAIKKVGSGAIWHRVATMEPNNKEILAISISKEKNMLVAERFVSSLIKTHGEHLAVSPDDGGIRYPQACRFLKVGRHLHFPYWKSIIERTRQYLKDRRTDNLMFTFLAKRRNANQSMS